MVERFADEESAVSGVSPRSRWTREQAAHIRRMPETVAPVVYPPEGVPNEDVHVWDTWLLRDRHGRVATVDGWQVAFSLTAAADLLPGTRHDVATIRYFYSRDGRTWHSGGRVFAEGRAFGQRQWAGSALYDDGDVYLYYTAAGEADADELRYSQRIAAASGATVRTGDERVAFDGEWDHRLLLRPDGELYETEAQSRAMTYTFRDPWFYENPETGETCLLFEANVPVPEGSDACGGDDAQQVYNGCVGVAVSESGDPLEWDLRPPILDGVCVNQELERPHVVRRDGRYYLFVSSHDHTFAPGIDGYDGLYGFVADSLGGPYRPLNDSGLVVTNPANAPFQAYSWMVLPHDEELLVQSFFNFYDFAGDSVDLIGELPESEQLRRFGGTLGPTLRLALDGDRTRIRGTLDAWHLPTADAALPDLAPDEPGSTRAFEGGRGSYGADESSADGN
ncbi:glycoside hydrolase family 68 protein [Halosimplex halophilum]|uniref:glycoside hydrolase family 68 protein n=1 Tax=Halosimplex halophilum TaxID=2559572 RepID=UPI00107EF270|nr:glycoside hydrolase family 68 protein [Halosimplex halophilum]